MTKYMNTQDREISINKDIKRVITRMVSEENRDQTITTYVTDLKPFVSKTTTREELETMVNNLVFLSNPRGKMTVHGLRSAKDLGMEAVDEDEQFLVHLIVETMKKEMIGSIR